MPRITRRTFGLGATAAAAAVAMPRVARAQEITLKLHQFLPAQANVPKLVLDPWIKKVQDESGGRIKIEHYPAMQLGGKPPELIDQVTDGIVDIVWTLPGSTPGRFPSTEVFELPFMMTNAEATSKAYWDLFEKNMKDTEFKDQHIIGTWVHGPGVVHCKEPINKLEDMSGKKIRAPTRVINQLLGALGATPVGMPVPQITDALSKGVIDGCVIPWEVTTSLKVPELVSNHTEFSGDHALYTTTFVMDLQHDVRGRGQVTLEELLQHHHDELHRRVVVVEQNHLVERRRLRAGGLALGNDRALATVPPGTTRRLGGQLWRFVIGHESF